jgi:hypothetical protein
MLQGVNQVFVLLKKWIQRETGLLPVKFWLSNFIYCNYNTPFVLGKSLLIGSLFTAMRMALANALKMASIL